MYSKDEVTMGEYEQCPRCDHYQVGEFLIVFTMRNDDERPDDWTRFLPWNWFGPTETTAFRTAECKHCGRTVHVEELDT